MTRRFPLFAVLGALLLTAAFWYFLYQPQVEEQAALEEETADLEATSQRLRLEIAHLEEVAADEERYRSELAVLAEHVPDTSEEPEVLGQLQAAADTSGVEVASLSLSPAELVADAPATGTPGTALVSIPAVMTVEGAYFQAVDFVRRLEVEVPRAVLVDGVQLNENADGFPTLSATVTGELFAVVPIAEQEGDEDDMAGAPTDGDGAGDAGEPAEGDADAGEQQ